MGRGANTDGTAPSLRDDERGEREGQPSVLDPTAVTERLVAWNVRTVISAVAVVVAMFAEKRRYSVSKRAINLVWAEIDWTGVGRSETPTLEHALTNAGQSNALIEIDPRSLSTGTTGLRRKGTARYRLTAQGKAKVEELRRAAVEEPTS